MLNQSISECSQWQSTGGLTAQVGWLDLRVDGRLAPSLHSCNEPGELLQWTCHNDSTINSVIGIIIVVVVVYYL